MLLNKLKTTTSLYLLIPHPLCHSKNFLKCRFQLTPVDQSMTSLEQTTTKSVRNLMIISEPEPVPILPNMDNIYQVMETTTGLNSTRLVTSPNPWADPTEEYWTRMAHELTLNDSHPDAMKIESNTTIKAD